MLTKGDLSEIGKVIDVRLKPVHDDIKTLQKDILRRLMQY